MSTFKHDIRPSELEYMLGQGLSVKEIAKRLDVSPVTIRNNLPSADKRKYTFLTDEQVDEAVRRVKAGESVYAIARDYGVAVTTVYRRLRQLGVSTDKSGRKKKAAEEVLPEPKAEERPAGRLTASQIGIYDGRFGRYLVDTKEHFVMIPEGPRWWDKESLGFLIRDLMIVWQEV